MKFLKYILGLFIVSLMCACNAVHSLQLNTVRPARVEYHIPHPSIAVINNSEIPDGSSYSRYIDENGTHYKLSYFADSVPSYFAMSLATQLYERNFFETVDVFFTDSTHITGIKGVSDEQKREWELYYPHMVNVVVNELKPQTLMNVEPLEGLFGAEIALKTSVQAQCIIPGKEVVEIAYADTLVWYSYGETPEMACNELPMFDMCLEESLSSLAMKVADNLAPYNRMVHRNIFVTGHIAMKDAYRYWDDELHDEASYIWEYVYKNANNKGRKAKAAANLAVYYELRDDYKQALEYAEKARSLFIEEQYVTESEYMCEYCNDLKQRIKDENILDASL